jgi:hypothetical protein
MDKFLPLCRRRFVFRSAVLGLRRLLRGDSRLRALISGLKGGLVAWIGLVREPAPAALVVLRLALEDRLAVIVEPLAFPAGRTHALAAIGAGDAPFSSGLAVAAYHAFGRLLVVLDLPLVWIVGGAVCVRVWSEVCYLVSNGAAFRRRRRHVIGCRHVEVVVVVVMVMMVD